MIRALLVDDHELVLAGFVQLLEKSDKIVVVGTASSGEEAITKVDELKPHVVLMDISMPGMGGLEASRRIRLKHPQVKIIGLSGCSESPVPQQLMNVGVHGYITKGSSLKELIHGIKTIFGGKRYISSDVANEIALAHLGGQRTSSPFEQLTQRELQIVMLTLQGKAPSEIADSLNISRKTVSTYRSRLDAKLGIKTDVELVKLCIQHKLIPQSQ